MKTELIAQGAEARLYSMDYFGFDAVLKERFGKTWRYPELDLKLTSRRVVQEARCLHKAFKANIHVPTVYFVDAVANTIIMEFIHGQTVKNVIFSADTETILRIGERLGTIIAKLHNENIIHGDLTTSNVVFEEATGEFVLIDFGLAFVSTMAEDKAVDLHVLQRAITSSHPTCLFLFQEIKEAYCKASNATEAVMAKLEEVEARGRKMSMIG